MSAQNPAVSTYLTSSSSFSSRVKLPLPEICAKPVRPGLTSSRFFCWSFHSFICETYSGRGPTTLISPFNILNNCGSSSSEYSYRNFPVHDAAQHSRTTTKHSAAGIPIVLPRHLANEEMASSDLASGSWRNCDLYLRIASNLAGR